MSQVSGQALQKGETALQHFANLIPSCVSTEFSFLGGRDRGMGLFLSHYTQESSKNKGGLCCLGSLRRLGLRQTRAYRRATKSSDLGTEHHLWMAAAISQPESPGQSGLAPPHRFTSGDILPSPNLPT